MRHKLLAFCLLFAAALNAQTKLNLNQLPACSTTATPTPTTPVVFILASVPVTGQNPQLTCYGLSGVSITPATATVPATINLGAVPNFADGEVPSGIVNSSNATFTLAHTPITGSLNIFKNGLLQQLNVDYTLSGNTITFAIAATPQASANQPDTLQASYRY